MRKELEDLVRRSEDQTADPASGQSVAWGAYRTAAELQDRTMVDELLDYAASERRWQRRAFAWFVVGKIGLNLADPSCAESLIRALPGESNKHVLSTMLDAIGEIAKPSEMDLSPIFALLHDARWLVRNAAIGSLRNSVSEQAESQLIALLSRTEDPDVMVCCNATLNEIGTPRAIPAISATLVSRKRDVKGSAELAIKAIRRRHTAKEAALDAVSNNGTSCD